MLASLLLAGSIAWTAPLAGAALTDHVTGERTMRYNGKPIPGRPGMVWEVHETNPTPGMGTFKGRLIWSAVELSVISLALESKKPKIRKAGKVAVVVMVIGHTICSINNAKRYQVIQREIGGKR